MQKPTQRNEEVADAFAKESGAKQVGVIVHGPNINIDAWEEDAEMLQGLLPVRCAGHTRLYKVPPAPQK